MHLKPVALAAALAPFAAALDVQVASSGGNKTSYHQYGFLHEDINNSGDGGIYAELIVNRAFQSSELYPVSLNGYHSLHGARLSIQNLSQPLSAALDSSMRVAAGNGSNRAGFENEGYWGMNVECQKYTGSFWVRGAYDGSFTASLQSNLTDDVFGSVEVPSQAVADDWVEHTFTLTPDRDAPNSNNTFAITFNPEGTENGYLDFNLISLFPPTYKDRPNGLRVDLAQVLEAYHPTVFRFPGGNMLEGNTNETYWDWKKTLGPLRERPGFPGVWGYMQTNGLGLMEYLELAEDINNMTIVVGVWAGLSLNGDITPRNDLQPFIDDALNEIEFIRGPADSPWGSRRAELGHPEPFNLQYVEVGNEDWLAGAPEGWNSYKEYRFPMFMQAINDAYPDIQVIASGATSDNYTFPAPAIGDYHPYREPDALVEEFNRFDNDLGHIVGEVSATFPNNGSKFDGPLFDFPAWIGAVGSAVSMIGYERNADRIPGTFYAPILRNMNRWQWAVTMIQHAADPALTTRSVSWYIWEALAASPISHTLPANEQFGPVFYVAGRDENRDDALVWKGACYNISSNDIYNSTYRANSTRVPVTVHFDGVESGTEATLTMVTNPGGDPYAMVDPLEGNKVVSTTETSITANADGVFEFYMTELSLAVLDTGVNKRVAGAPYSPIGKKDHDWKPRMAGKPPGYRPAV
ncbi:putative vacuolar segregation protein [Hortaea werneckii]|uniref:non-reducing end alpha-L-arabinofuranosidase n=2 Tax=Hortaea werneckii TaxID=91943 RepID=A0A3M7JAV0_HORWE|nr:putative vacuolar segregation protein [Hortaea werneckii]OTA28164.1 hypothetical protein BTJ68_10867 [Hortaea werneckii EXF-2000]KAI6850179.1 putative vacuolar segregation protein [Hortaea werneckii]KAI6852356.1 putative vacuolar segregation protein [Hortaea werneckii]KAI6944218.1 putative vacuolar segregation protein [Hortaea werneckii]